ncbi:hypothetical protein HPB49_003859 [Dermacentor silvarum]|uniref:Uncharacterized protein n=1 Tax=Dermacentor silvarum TaxID=543639 RepID=A0ACB8DTX5_DERSI|nr:hypothetical protein HPB49_003859 [Dermacentor silvarum]
MAKGWVSFLAVCLAGLAVLYQVEVEQDRWVASQVITLKASAGDAYRFVTTSEYMSKASEFHTSYHVVEYVPLRKVAVESESWLRPRLELRFESSGDAQCRMHVLVSFRRRSYLFQYTLGPVLHFVSNQQLQRSLFLLRMVFPQ